MHLCSHRLETVTSRDSNKDKELVVVSGTEQDDLASKLFEMADLKPLELFETPISIHRKLKIDSRLPVLSGAQQSYLLKVRKAHPGKSHNFSLYKNLNNLPSRILINTGLDSIFLVGNTRSTGVERYEQGLSIGDTEELNDACNLLLSLLVSRGCPDLDVLNSNTKLAQGLNDLIEKLIEIAISHGIKLQAQVNMEIVLPETRAKVDPLLYVLNSYLTGDDGTNDIKISVKTLEDED